MAFTFSFPRYLESKQHLDDRSLNGHVIEALKHHAKVCRLSCGRRRPAAVLDIGSGTASMYHRLRTWLPDQQFVYHALEADPANVAFAMERLTAEGLACVLQPRADAGEHVAADAYFHQQAFESFVPTESFDLVTAQSFLDLVNLPQALAAIVRATTVGGMLYFSLNFDGLTTFEPTIDREFDDLIEQRYHHSMDTRSRDGVCVGDSRTGRHILSLLSAEGAKTQIVAAGASDWIVHPQRGSYAGDEMYFLYCILHWVEQVLKVDQVVDQRRLDDWLSHRRRQVASGRLIFIAHQSDVLARVTG